MVDTTEQELLDRAGVAAALGIKVKSVDKIRERAAAGTGPVFPEPVRTFGRTPVWRMSDIARFQRENRADVEWADRDE